MSASADLVTIRMPARLWSVVDAEVDNVVSMAVVDGEDDTVEMGDAIRDNGPARVEGVDWSNPPTDLDVDIDLTREQWLFAVHHLERSEASYERIGYQESLDLGRRARAVIEEQLV